MPTGLTCGSTNGTAASLECIGGAPQWEGGYLAVYIMIAVLFVICVGVSVFLIRKSAPNHCFDLTWHDRCEGPLAPPLFLATWRGVFFVFFLVVEAMQVFDYGFAVFQAYTVWNFCFQLITMGIGFQVSLHFALGHKAYFCGSERYQNICERTHMLMLEITFPLSILVCVVVWMLLVPLGCPLLTFTSFIQHLTNVFVLAVDFILSGYPVDLRHFAIIVFIVAVYASFVQVFYVMNGSTNCVYPFLMPNCPLSVVWYLGMLLTHFLVFLLAWGLWNIKFCCRRTCAEKGRRCCTTYGRAGDHKSFVQSRRDYDRRRSIARSSASAARQSLVKTEGEETSEFAGVSYGT